MLPQEHLKNPFGKDFSLEPQMPSKSKEELAEEYIAYRGMAYRERSGYEADAFLAGYAAGLESDKHKKLTLGKGEQFILNGTHELGFVPGDTIEIQSKIGGA